MSCNAASTARTSIIRVLLVALALGVSAQACSDDKDASSAPNGTTSPKQRGTNTTSAAEAAGSKLLESGLGAHAAGDLAVAEKEYRAAIAADPQNKLAYYNLALVFQQTGKAAEAEDNYRLAVGLDANYSPALFNLAILRAEAGAQSEAVDLYRRAIAADPQSASAHFNLGLLLIKTGNDEEGNAEVKAAIAIDPSLQSRLETDETTPEKPATTPASAP